MTLLDRPRPARTKVVQPGKIIVKGAPAARDCTVDNLNMTGACISFDSGGAAADLPDKFDLTFDNGHSFWSCDVIWRNKSVGRVGVTWKIG
jgi:hypothetical protein